MKLRRREEKKEENLMKCRLISISISISIPLLKEMAIFKYVLISFLMMTWKAFNNIIDCSK